MQAAAQIVVSFDDDRGDGHNQSNSDIQRLADIVCLCSVVISVVSSTWSVLCTLYISIQTEHNEYSTQFAGKSDDLTIWRERARR